MSRSSSLSGPAPIVFAVIFVIFGIVLGFVVTRGTTVSSLGVTLGLVMLILSFVRIDLALYFLILSMLLSPEISLGGLEEQGVSGGRSVVVRLDDLFLMLVAFGWLARSAIFKEIGLIIKSPINGQIYAYTAAFVIATGAGILYGDVELMLGIFNCLKFVQYFLLFFMVLNYIDTEKQARNLINAALFTGFIIAVYALSQVPSGARITAPFEGKSGEPNTLGGYLLIILSISLGIFLEVKNLYRQVMFAVMSLLCVIGIFYTESRSSYIGMLLSVFVLIFYARRRNILLMGVVVTLIFSTVLLPSRVIERISYTFRNENVDQFSFSLSDESNMEKLDSSTQARLQSWKEAYEGWRKYPILGWGVTGFTFIDAQYMKILVETGAVGFVTFIILMIGIFQNLRRIRKTVKDVDDFYHGITVGTLAGFIGLLGHAIGTNTFIIIRIMEPFWLFLGIVLSIPKILPETRTTDEKKYFELLNREQKEEEEPRVRFFT